MSECAATTSACNSQFLGSLRPALFWDVDASQLDPERHALYLIERVAERGDLDDMLEVWRYYGPERIARALQTSRALTTRTVCFFAVLFSLPLESFRSYRKGLGDAVPT